MLWARQKFIYSYNNSKRLRVFLRRIWWADSWRRLSRILSKWPILIIKKKGYLYKQCPVFNPYPMKTVANIELRISQKSSRAAIFAVVYILHWLGSSRINARQNLKMKTIKPPGQGWICNAGFNPMHTAHGSGAQSSPLLPRHNFVRYSDCLEPYVSFIGKQQASQKHQW